MSSIKEQVLAQQGQYKESDDKYLSVLKQYNCNLNDEEVAAAVKKILDEKVAENETMEVKKFLFGSIELTSLHTEDTEESILKMIEKVNQFAKDYPQLPHVATVCTYPNFAGLISQSLEVDGVEIAVVSGNFPSSQTFIEVKIAETAMAIKDGATEVDIVMPVGKFFSEDYEGLCDDIQELKETCGEHKMKCILETGDLKNCSNIMKASIPQCTQVLTTSKPQQARRRSQLPLRQHTLCARLSRHITKRRAFRLVSSLQVVSIPFMMP